MSVSRHLECPQTSSRLPRVRARLAAWALAGLAMILLPTVASATEASVLDSPVGEPSTIELDTLNRVYQDLDSDLEPIRQGPIVIHVSSPEHRLEVHGNRLSLTANTDGTVDAVIEVDFEGGGQLIADVEGFGRFVDRVEAPRQTVHVAGTVRLSRVESGYLITIVDSDPVVQLVIKSELADQIVGVCEAAALIPLISLPCGGVATALETVSLPLPAAGSQLLLPSAEMSGEEKATFDRYIKSSPTVAE